uniref:Si:ch73-290k24.5 n=1 Tax=Cyprinus carpio TaxID=7962 RepID=A0A8C2JWZ2_CYPCA
MSTSTKLPFRCPACGEACGFGEHLSSAHSCQKLCLAPRRSSEGGLMSLYTQRESEIDRPLRLELLDALSLALLAVAMSSRAAEADAGHAVAQLGVPWLGRLALEARLQQLALEVQERVSLKLEALQDEVQRRSVEVRRARRESESMHREKRQAEERAAELERQVDISVEMLASLRYELRERDEQLRRKQQEVCDLDRFVRDTALQEATAKIRLQHFIEDLLERAERAETQLQNLHDDVTSPHRHLAGSRTSGYQVHGVRFQMNTFWTEAAQLYLILHQSCPGLHWCVNRSSDSAVCSERLRLKAALFCVFTYLDTRSLLTAAEVCKDWCSVARHPAVWTTVTLENARVSSKARKHTHTHTHTRLYTGMILQRGKRDTFLAGLEAVLKSGGRSLVTLSVSHCPNILTDRSLWLVSCHCRSLQSLTYRSASDPVGQEVIWALGAGCRDITTLRIAPLQPCLQPSRFSNRCLQTIGRCWPNLCRVGVGGCSWCVSAARNCVNLCELELHHMNEVNQEAAAEICRDGLQQLHTLRFISTPVTARALLHFSSEHLNSETLTLSAYLIIHDYDSSFKCFIIYFYFEFYM